MPGEDLDKTRDAAVAVPTPADAFQLLSEGIRSIEDETVDAPRDAGEETLFVGQEQAGAPRQAPTKFDAKKQVLPEVIGQYRIIRVIGHGGMGVVLEAVQETFIRRHVALKMPRTDTGDRERVLQRFRCEAAILARLQHPAVVTLFDAGVFKEQPYFVMERVQGSPLRRHCDRMRLSIPNRLSLFAELCDAVHYVNGRGVVHRNINPHNVMVTTLADRNGIKLLDFGIAKPLYTDDMIDAPPEQEGQMIGSLAYMSPEQARGLLTVDARTDVYALGVLLYELLTGRRPIEVNWSDSSLPAIVNRIVHDRPPPPSELYAKLDGQSLDAAKTRDATPAQLAKMMRGELDDICHKCLRKGPDNRFSTAGEIAQRIRAWQPKKSWFAGK